MKSSERLRLLEASSVKPIQNATLDNTNLLQRVLEIGKHVLTESSLVRTLSYVIDGAMEIAKAENGVVIVFNDDGELLLKEIRSQRHTTTNHPSLKVGSAAIEKVQSTGAPIFLVDALDDADLRLSNPALSPDALSIICLPILHAKQVIGAIYLDAPSKLYSFSSEVYTLIEYFCDFVSLPIYHGIRRYRKQKSTLVGGDRSPDLQQIIGRHPSILDMLCLVGQVADSDATVLIQGESGTGKELIARALHNNSCRKDKHFVAINSGALPETLLESELFGHTRGSFTGAVKDKPGLFERANGGTFFLDEAGEMPSVLQVKLLRVLQTREYSPVGSVETRRCNVRVVAATSQPLADMVKAGRFRQELYYRLNVIDLYLLPLRDRRIDIPLLIDHFINRYAAKYDKQGIYLSSEAESVLMNYSFPGNIRELENIIQRAVVLAQEDVIGPIDLPARLRIESHGLPSKDLNLGFKLAKRKTVQQFERDYIAGCLKEANGNISRAAQAAGINIKNFHVKMTHYGIDPHTYKAR
jgi:Nif-specific regulatory protein